MLISWMRRRFRVVLMYMTVHGISGSLTLRIGWETKQTYECTFDNSVNDKTGEKRGMTSQSPLLNLRAV